MSRRSSRHCSRRSRMASADTTLAIIVGASDWPKYKDLAASEAFARSARELREYLLDENGFGLTEANLLDLFDTEAEASTVDERIGEFLDARQKALHQVGSDATDLFFY